MRTQNSTEETPKTGSLTSVNPNHENFSFDSWASAVRERMLAVLQNNVSAATRKSKVKSICL